MKNIWTQLNKPLLIQAPMYDVSDLPFRQMLARYGKPDIMFTEFVSCRGLFSPGREALSQLIEFQPKEQPLVVQFFGREPEYFYRAALLAQEKGFSGIDINMGCPDKNILKQKSGSSLIQDPQLAQEIIKQTQRGAGDLPVSVKTRTGYGNPSIKEWIPILLEMEPSAISIHGRTKSQGYGGLADWDLIKQAKEVAVKLGSKTKIIGNGDIKTFEQADSKIHEYGVDGVMIGRALIGNPWFFNKELNREDLTLEQRFQVMVEHAELFEKHYQEKKKFYNMRKYFCSYLIGCPNTKALKKQLMQVNSASELKNLTI